MDEVRLHRLENTVRDQISMMIMQDILKDPRIGKHLGISHIKLSPDASYAKIYMSSYENSAVLEKAVKALNKATGFIQGRLGKNMRMKNPPKLSFYADRSIELGIEMSNKIENLFHCDKE